jgi:hypothetical protein
MTMTAGQARDALADLQFHWGSAYAIAGAAGCWVARRRDNGQLINASGPEGLREQLAEDYRACPVPREVAP